ncbi:MAG: hypothetical protein AB1746_06485 [Candidatus Zixiibacteriota bacterium]
MRKVLLLIIVLLGFSGGAQAEEKMTVGSLIDSVLAARQRQLDAVSDMTFDAIFYERRTDKEGNITEEKRYDKKIYVKKIDDTFHIHQKYIALYLDGVRQDREALVAEVDKKQEERAKRGGRDFTYDLTIPLQMLYTGMYDVSYKGMTKEKVDGYICYMLRADAREDNDTLINCLYYVDTAGFNLVKVDFSPAHLTNKLMFKLKELNMTIHYKPYNTDIWIPDHFELQGRGKAAFFIGVYFQSEETYTNPVINSGLDDALFEERISVEEI